MIAVAMRRLKENVLSHPYTYFFPALFFAIGFFSGLFLPRFLSEYDQSSLIHWTTEGINSSVAGFSFSMVFSSIWNNLRLTAAVILCAYLWIASPISICALGVKTFGMGIFIHAMHAVYGAWGVFVGIVYLAPQSFFYLLGYWGMCARSLQVGAQKTMLSPLGKRAFWIELTPCFLSIFAGIVLECTLGPLLLGLL